MLKIGLTGSIACGKSFIARLFAVYGVTIIDSDLISREIVLPHAPTLKALVAAFGEKILTPQGSLNRPLLRKLVFSDNSKLATLNSIMHPAIRARTEELCAICAQGQMLPSTYHLVCAQTRAQRATERDHMLLSGLEQSVVYGTDGVILNDARTVQAQMALQQPLEPSLVLHPQVGVAPPYIMLDIPLLLENHLEDMVDRILVVDAAEDTQVQRIVARDHCSEELARSIIAKQVPRAVRVAAADDIIVTDKADIAEKQKHVLNLHRKYLELAAQKAG